LSWLKNSRNGQDISRNVAQVSIAAMIASAVAEKGEICRDCCSNYGYDLPFFENKIKEKF